MKRLTWSNMSPADQIMLPFYLAWFLWVGIGWAGATEKDIERTEALNYVNNNWMGIRSIGFLFIFAAICMFVAFCLGRVRLYQFALVICIIPCVGMVIAFGGAWLHEHSTSVGPAWPTFPVAACCASFRSLQMKRN